MSRSRFYRPSGHRLSAHLRPCSPGGGLTVRTARPGIREAALRILAAFTLVTSPLPGATWVPAGDLRLRHDLQWLADHNVVEASLQAWPVTWSSIDATLSSPAEDSPVSDQVVYRRIRRQLNTVSTPGYSPTTLRVSVATHEYDLRSFEAVPRERAEVGLKTSWLGNRFAGTLDVSYVPSTLSPDNERWRLDGSYITGALGNWMLSLDKIDRWWGPGYDGSLILSNNARPVSALTLQRLIPREINFPVLRRLGRWSTTTFIGRLGDDRVDEFYALENAPPRPVVNPDNPQKPPDYDNPYLWGWRVDWQPFRTLNIGFSRTGQFGGDDTVNGGVFDRPSGFDTFLDLVGSQDNTGGLDEPGNQLAGIDVRWRLPFGIPGAVYGQVIGEDEDDFLPEALMFQFGGETWGSFGDGYTWRAHFEVADTTTEFYKDGDRGTFGFAYDHFIYLAGYRYHGRSLGHTTDGDSLSKSLGALLVDPDGRSLGLTVRRAVLNRFGPGINGIEVRRDLHSLTEDRTEVTQVDVFASFPVDRFSIKAGVRYSESRLQDFPKDRDVSGYLNVSYSF